REAEPVGLLGERQVRRWSGPRCLVAEVEPETHGTRLLAVADGKPGRHGAGRIRVSGPLRRGAPGRALTAGSFRHMRHGPLGRAGLVVSRFALGTMTWGRDTDGDDAAAQLKTYVEVGGNLLDTADVYADGVAEEVVGGLLGTLVAREDLLIAT